MMGHYYCVVHVLLVLWLTIRGDGSGTKLERLLRGYCQVKFGQNACSEQDSTVAVGMGGYPEDHAASLS